MLSRTDEMILLAVWRLGDNAYGVSIAEMLTQISRKNWILGSSRAAGKEKVSDLLLGEINQKARRS